MTTGDSSETAAEPLRLAGAESSPHRLRLARTAGSFLLGALVGGGAGTAIGGASPRRVTQPIAFNHAFHVEGGIACGTCHAGSEEGIRAGLPAMRTCLECHEEPLGEVPEEAKVRDYLEHGDAVPWLPLAAIREANVFFSHRRHTRVAGIACETCHGAVRGMERPPERAFIEWSMDDCLDCHRREGASEDCLACHR